MTWRSSRPPPLPRPSGGRWCPVPRCGMRWRWRWVWAGLPDRWAWIGCWGVWVFRGVGCWGVWGCWVFWVLGCLGVYAHLNANAKRDKTDRNEMKRSVCRNTCTAVDHLCLTSVWLMVDQLKMNKWAFHGCCNIVHECTQTHTQTHTRFLYRCPLQPRAHETVRQCCCMGAMAGSHIVRGAFGSAWT